MSWKTLVWIGLFIGSTMGGALPLLWGGSFFGMASVILSAAGGLAGIWGGYRFAKAAGLR